MAFRWHWGVLDGSWVFQMAFVWLWRVFRCLWGVLDACWVFWMPVGWLWGALDGFGVVQSIMRWLLSVVDCCEKVGGFVMFFL